MLFSVKESVQMIILVSFLSIVTDIMIKAMFVECNEKCTLIKDTEEHFCKSFNVEVTVKSNLGNIFM